MIHLIHLDPPNRHGLPKTPSIWGHMEWEVVIHMDLVD
jgi:hypothetical protein